MSKLIRREWVPTDSEDLVQRVASDVAARTVADLGQHIHTLIDDNRRIHERECLNLNPATNVMNPRAEAALAAGLGTRPSLGYPGAKYEMGLEATEQIEVIAAELAAEVFRASYAEVRVPSGAIGNLFAFMATAQPGDAIIVPPAAIGGHVTHHRAGSAGLYGLEIHEAPIDPDRYTIDPVKLRDLARQVRPKVITVGGSLNLRHHPVREIREVADEVGAAVLFDAAHLSGPIAGGAWPDPLADGAHLMSLSTYKSLGGPPSGLIVTNDAALAERIDAIAYPGLTANFDAAKTAALAITLLDWKAFGVDYATEMTASAAALAAALQELEVEVYSGTTSSHAFAVDARRFGGGHAAALRLRQANLLTSGIGLPTDTQERPMGGLRIGLNEAVRWGLSTEHMTELAHLVVSALTAEDPGSVARDVTDFRSRFRNLHFMAEGTGATTR